MIWCAKPQSFGAPRVVGINVLIIVNGQNLWRIAENGINLLHIITEIKWLQYCKFNLKVSKSQKQFMVSSILQKKTQGKLPSWASFMLRIATFVHFWKNWEHHKLLSRLSYLDLIPLYYVLGTLSANFGYDEAWMLNIEYVFFVFFVS